MRGGDELVGVRLHAGGDPHQHILDDARRTGDGLQALDLDLGVDHDVPDAGVHRGGELVDGLVVAVHGDSLGREAGVQRDRELAAGRHVQRQALLVHPAGDLAAQERLGGVVHVLPAAEGRGDLTAAVPGNRPRR